MPLSDRAAAVRKSSLRKTIAIFGSLLSVVATSAAQAVDDQDVLPSSPVALPGFLIPPMDSSEVNHRMTELKEWVRDYTEWKRWSDEWLNRTESGWLAARQRRVRPILPSGCPRIVGTWRTLRAPWPTPASSWQSGVTTPLRQSCGRTPAPHKRVSRRQPRAVGGITSTTTASGR